MSKSSKRKNESKVTPFKGWREESLEILLNLCHNESKPKRTNAEKNRVLQPVIEQKYKTLNFS